jgi:hypothetical protein
MSRLQEPLKLPKHPQLLDEINQTIIDIKFHDDEKPMMIPTETLTDLRKKHTKHSWQDVCELLRKCYNAINEQREDPRRY